MFYYTERKFYYNRKNCTPQMVTQYFFQCFIILHDEPIHKEIPCNQQKDIQFRFLAEQNQEESKKE